MKYTNLNEKLNATIKSHLTEDVNIVHYLMEVLDISRESAYRRLRNEILFSMQEIAILASKLHFSVDDILTDINFETKEQSCLTSEKDILPADNYVEMIKSTINVFYNMPENQQLKAFYVGNKISNGMLFNYKMLSKLRYIRWVHQTHNLPINSRFSEITLPPQVEEVHKEYLGMHTKIEKTVSVLDNNIIQAVINTIKFYYRRNLITDSEVLSMKTELCELVNQFETIMRTGKNIFGSDSFIYLSDLNIESNILLLEFDKGMSVHLLSSGKKPIISTNKRVCEEQKLWIDSLLKFSVLMTRSNEILQTEFVTRQYDIIETEFTQLLAGNKPHTH